MPRGLARGLGRTSTKPSLAYRSPAAPGPDRNCPVRPCGDYGPLRGCDDPQGHKHGEHLVKTKKPWRANRKRAGLEDVRIHALRHTFASVAAASGASLPIIGKLLGHAQSATTERYAHLSVDPVRL